MKGIILAGGSGTRLYPITKGVSKQLLPLYDKPMIYYPISTLMSAGINDILIITTIDEQKNFKKLLGDGSDFGIKLSYEVQNEPNGLAQAFIIGESFIGNDSCAMVLGDNLFYGLGFRDILKQAIKSADSGIATIFGVSVNDPNRFGIMEVDNLKNIISIEEKPLVPKSDLAVCGIYFYPVGVSNMAKNVKLSSRNEYEITCLNKLYLEKQLLKGEILPNEFIWYDTGTFNSLLNASNSIKIIQESTGSVVSCLEEIALGNDWLTVNELKNIKYRNSYGDYLKKVVRKYENENNKN